VRKSESLPIAASIAFVLLAVLACKKHETSNSVTTTETATVGANAPESTTTAAVEKSTYKVGDKVSVRWQGQTYPSTIIAVLPNDKYKIHYIGWESSWDETVGLDRIVGAKGAPAVATTTATVKKPSGGGGGGDAPCPGPGITRRCGGVCVNIQTDDNNCGGCGTVCSGGKHCDGHLFCRDSEGNL
jgi:hypothetical protein